MESADDDPPGEKKMVTFETHERYPDNQIQQEIQQANSVDGGGQKSCESGKLPTTVKNHLWRKNKKDYQELLKTRKTRVGE